MFLKFLIGILCLTMMGCTFGAKQKGSPQDILSQYISRSFAVKSFSEKGALIEFTSGEVKNILESLDEHAFKAYFIDNQREFLSLKIRDERALSPDRYSITYEISYVAKGQNQQIDKVTNKKHALFEKTPSGWRIFQVQNLKTFIDHQNAISF